MNRFFKCFAFIILLTWTLGTKNSLAQNSISPFHINAGATFSQSPVPFSTLFKGMYVLTSPLTGTTPGTGQFAFMPDALFQITFSGLTKPLRLECEVGSSLGFKITKSLPGAVPVTEYVGSVSIPNKVGKYITINMPDLIRSGDTIIIVEAAIGNTATWGLSDCLITERS